MTRKPKELKVCELHKRDKGFAFEEYERVEGAAYKRVGEAADKDHKKKRNIVVKE